MRPSAMPVSSIQSTVKIMDKSCTTNSVFVQNTANRVRITQCSAFTSNTFGIVTQSSYNSAFIQSISSASGARFMGRPCLNSTAFISKSVITPKNVRIMRPYATKSLRTIRGATSSQPCTAGTAFETQNTKVLMPLNIYTANTNMSTSSPVSTQNTTEQDIYESLTGTYLIKFFTLLLAYIYT